MGFYGNITNQNRVSFSFDKIYSNRKAMDTACANDGIYAGRYVLIEYEKQVNDRVLPRAILYDNVLYAAPPATAPKDSDTVALIPYQANGNLVDQDIDAAEPFKIRVGCLVCVPSSNHFGSDLTAAGTTGYYRIENYNTTKNVTKLYYNYTTHTFSLGDNIVYDEMVCTTFTRVDQTSFSIQDESSYYINFNIDKSYYGASRGYDSTVWQKTYVDGSAKYVMIAELNSVVPILDVSADAPTFSPMMPHFDKDSTNVYYKLHLQPTWGFRVKAANNNLALPHLATNGDIEYGVFSGTVSASTDIKQYPSDVSTVWFNTKVENDGYINQALVPSTGNDASTWIDTEELDNAASAQVPAAIYFNKAGFNPAESVHSTDPEIRNTWGGRRLQDEITLTPSGRSGHLYGNHPIDGENTLPSDVNELAIVLPSVGDAIADLWDIIYGNNKVNGTELLDTHPRNTIIEWEDAKASPKRRGLRLVKGRNKLQIGLSEDDYNNTIDKLYTYNEATRQYEKVDIDAIFDPQTMYYVDGGYGYTYDTGAINTLAGIINSAQDLMGMIITDFFPDEEDRLLMSKISEDYIYYNPVTGKYYYKKRSYKYIKVTDPEFEDISWPDPVTLTAWPTETNTQYYWFDLTSKMPDYIMQQEYQKNKYYTTGITPGTLNGTGSKFSAEYQPNKFYLVSTSTDPSTQSKYKKYILSTSDVRDPDCNYYSIKPTPVLEGPEDEKDPTIIYKPNRYFRGIYRPILLPITDRDSYNDAIKNYTRLFYRSENSMNIASYGTFSNGKEILSYEDWEQLSPVNKDNIYYLDLITCTDLTYEVNKDNIDLYDATYSESALGGTNFYMKDQYYEYIPNIDNMAFQANVFYYFPYLEAKYDENGKLIEVEESVRKAAFDKYTAQTLNGKKNTDAIIDSSNKFTGNVALLTLDSDSLRNPYCLYFRLVISAQLVTPENVVNITTAKKINHLVNLGDNAYYKYIDEVTGDVGYKQLTVNTYDEKTFSIKANPLYRLEVSQLILGYHPNQYYYQITDPESKYFGSYLLDTSPDPDPNAIYYKAIHMNKERITFSLADDSADRNYFTYNEINEAYTPIEYEDMVAGNTYYVDTLREAPRFYQSGDYYYATIDTDGEVVYEVDKEDTITPDRQYYMDPTLYVVEGNGFYNRGAIWPIHNQDITKIPEGIQLGIRQDTWKMEELPGFARDMNSLHGLLLTLNKTLLVNDRLTRDDRTVAGAINTINDLIHRIDVVKPGRIMTVNDCGSIVGTRYTTTQTFSATNYGSSETVTPKNTPSNTWLNLAVDPDHTDPLITLTHTFTPVDDTTTTSDNNTGAKDTLNLYTPIVDAMGHVVGHNTETATLPFGYKNVTTNNFATNTAINSTGTLKKDTIIATNTQDTIAINSDNKWIRVDANNTTKTITLAHDIHAIDEVAAADSDLNSGNDDIIIQDISYDAAGHITGNKAHKYTLPYSFKQINTNGFDTNTAVNNTGVVTTTPIIADNTQDTLTINSNNKWIRISTAEDSDTLTFAHDIHAITTTDKITTDLNGKDTNNNVINTITLQDITYDEAGHLTACQNHTYTLPFGYKYFTDGVTTSTAINTQDTFTFVGDSWLTPTVATGKVTYTHKNDNTKTGYTNGSHALGAQNPDFGSTFNIQTFETDSNGHIISKGTETVTLHALSLTDNTATGADVITQISLVQADGAFSTIRTNIGNLTLADYGTNTTNLKATNTINAAFRALDVAIDTEITNRQNAITGLNGLTTDNIATNGTVVTGVSETAGIITVMTKTLTSDDIPSLDISKITGTGTMVTENAIDYVKADSIGTMAKENADDYTKTEDLGDMAFKDSTNYITFDTVFEYKAAVPAETREATEEDVENGDATEIGEIIEITPEIPAVTMTIGELIAKIQELESKL